jgi:hypothetical protein
LNTFRLWVVQLFAIIKEYEVEYAHENESMDANLCKMIEYKVNKTEHILSGSNVNFNQTCEPVSALLILLSIAINLKMLDLFA